MLRICAATSLWIGRTVGELGSEVSMFVFPLVAYATTGSTLLPAGARGPGRPGPDHARRQRVRSG
jgi:hypothetical protein